MRIPKIDSLDKLLSTVERLGFLPFFANEIEGFSIEEHCPVELWFAPDRDGPWEWKGPAARSGRCVYGKFFGGRAGYVSLEWLPDFANFRRNGYDFDARFDEGLAQYKDREVYAAIQENGKILSKRLKQLCNYSKDGNKGFETVITRLQMQTYVTAGNFVYMRDKYGKPYGWGVAEYTTPEALFGYETVTGAYASPPEESRARILDHLAFLLPRASDDELEKFIK
jgi:hypothetical protein